MVASGGDSEALAAQVASLASERDMLVVQLENVVAQLEAATGEKEALLAHAQGLVDERSRLASQVGFVAHENVFESTTLTCSDDVSILFTSQMSQVFQVGGHTWLSC